MRPKARIISLIVLLALGLFFLAVCVVEEVRRIIVTTLRNVDGILFDKPVDALYVEMGD